MGFKEYSIKGSKWYELGGLKITSFNIAAHSSDDLFGFIPTITDISHSNVSELDMHNLAWETFDKYFENGILNKQVFDKDFPCLHNFNDLVVNVKRILPELSAQQYLPAL